MKNKNFLKIADKVIETEIKSLKKLKSNIGKSFNKAVNIITKCKNGKVIVSGVGKSGLIGKKISSTLSSTGTPSFFLDSSSASHGDLGQIGSNDVVILLSLSGESEELKNIIQYCSRNKKISLIAITSKKNSLLGKASDICILLPNVTEAGPGNIVPTSSTIIQLSIGDALALSCMEQKKFGKLDFKKFHPGGNLSIKLKTVEDLMIKGKKIPFVNEESLMKNAIKVLNRKNIGVLIIKKGISTVGILTDGDLKRASQKYKNFNDIKIKKLMTKNPIRVKKDMLAAQALSIMNSKKITSLCVHEKNNNKTVGIIHIHDILKANIQ